MSNDSRYRPPSARRDKSKPKVVDEMCHCGHLKSKHNTSTNGIPGHGSCAATCGPKCSCAQFTWKSFLYASQHIIRRPRKHNAKVRP